MKHKNRHSIRLKGYDYSKAGSYFITICTQQRAHLFGDIENNDMILNDAGTMIKKWFLKLPSKFPDISLGNYIIMPNHFHAIIVNNGFRPVGADPRVCPSDADGYNNGCKGEHGNECKGEHGNECNGEHVNKQEGEHVGSPLPTIVQWFKTMTTNEYIRGVKTMGWTPFNGKLWQRNYYEHIIRTEYAFENISNYIQTNPSLWAQDQLNTPC